MFKALLSAGDYTSNYWASVIGFNTDSHRRFNDVAVLSSGDIVAGGVAVDFFVANGAMARISRQGRVVWRKKNGSSDVEGVVADGSDNIFIGASKNNAGIGLYGAQSIRKWDADASGSLSISYYFDNSSTFKIGGLALDGSGNIYTVGHTNDEGAGGYDLLVAKFDSSGTLLWDRTLGNASYDQYGYGIATDGSGNVYVAGYSTTAGASDAIIAKYNTSGTIQWQRKLSSSAFYGVGVDSSGNVYTCGGNDLVKYNSSGAIQFQKTLTGASFDALHITSDDRIFCVGDAAYDLLVVEYNTSGTIQWQNKLGLGGNEWGYGVTVDEHPTHPAVVVCGATDSTAFSTKNSAVVSRLPVDGSLTGTYGSFTYGAAGLTAGTGSDTDAAGGLTDTAAVLSTTVGTASSSDFTGTTDYRTVFRP